MKAQEFRVMSKEELLKKEKELKEELFALRFQNALGRLENVRRIREVKRDIARIKTILREKELGR